jgi:tetratricopeptide (TPR) repeat protein
VQAGQVRAAARAQAIAGRALRHWGRLAEAREQLTAALEVLRADPDTDTVRALGTLAAVEISAGSPDADRLSAEALTLGQALGVGDAELSRLLNTRGIHLSCTDRLTEAAAYYRESARLASQSGDSIPLGQALFNLAADLGAPIPGRRRRPRGPPPGTCAGSATGAA